MGINTAMIWGAQGISFAIPTDTAKRIVPQLLTHGRVRRGYLGMAGRQRPMDRWLAQLHDLTNTHVVELMVIEPDGPAARAGLMEGDLLVAVNDQTLNSMDELHRLLADWPPKPLTLTVIRGLDRLLLRVVPTEAP